MTILHDIAKGRAYLKTILHAVHLTVSLVVNIESVLILESLRLSAFSSQIKVYKVLRRIIFTKVLLIHMVCVYLTWDSWVNHLYLFCTDQYSTVVADLFRHVKFT